MTTATAAKTDPMKQLDTLAEHYVAEIASLLRDRDALNRHQLLTPARDHALRSRTARLVQKLHGIDRARGRGRIKPGKGIAQDPDVLTNNWITDLVQEIA